MIPALRLTPTDVTILRAACLDGHVARAAAEELRRTVDIDALDYGRQRLLPLLQRNLLRLGVDDWNASRMRGVRRYFWARSEMRLRALRPALAALATAGIDTVLLKGAALVAGGLFDLAERPMDDLDVLVRPQALATVIDVLASHGFQPRRATRADLLSADSLRLHGWTFADHAGNELDLHWHVLHADRRPRADDAFWSGIRPVSFLDIPTHVLDPTDQLLHTIAHAARWGEIPTPRWMADAAALVREGQGGRWDHLVRQARRHRLAPAIHDALAQLGEHLDVAVPPGILRRLRHLSHPATRREMTLAGTYPNALRPRQAAVLALLEHRRGDPRLWRLPLIATAWHIQRAAVSRPRAVALVAFWMTGQPRRLRRLLRVDRWARARPDALPQLGARTDQGVPPEAYLDGWHEPEGTGRWSSGCEARIGVRLPPGEARAMRCELSARLVLAEGLGPLKVRVFANDHLIASWRGSLRSPLAGRHILTIPASVVSGRRTLILSFVTDETRVPADIGLGRDVRPLGVFIGELTMHPLPSDEPTATRRLQDGQAPPM